MVVPVLVTVAVFWLTAVTVPGQAPAAGQQGGAVAGRQGVAAAGAGRTQDGKPNLNGIWQAMTTANWDIEAHQAEPGPQPTLLGAWGAQPGGLGIVEGGTIPYKPEALKKKQENFKNRMVVKVTNDPHRFDTGDPELQCYRPGVPRANYMPYPFQIFQTQQQLLMVYEYKGAVRNVYMDPHREAPADSWMGWSNGHWEGNTLVIDVTAFNGLAWFDRAGNFASDTLHVVERFTPRGADHIMYEATIEDPAVFTRPWKMSFPIYRVLEPNAQLVEFNCVPFVEQMMYEPIGLYKQPSTK